MGTSSLAPAPESSASRNLARPPLRPPPRTLRRQEVAVDFALGNWAPFDRPARAREEQPSSPAAKRPRNGSPLVVEEEEPAAAEAAAVAAFLGSPNAAWNWLPGGDRGAIWQYAQAAGAKLGLSSHRAARKPSRCALERVCADAAEVHAGDAGDGDHNPALVSFDGSVGGGSDDDDDGTCDDEGGAAPATDIAMVTPARRVTSNNAPPCYVALSES